MNAEQLDILNCFAGVTLPRTAFPQALQHNVAFRAFFDQVHRKETRQDTPPPQCKSIATYMNLQEQHGDCNKHYKIKY